MRQSGGVGGLRLPARRLGPGHGLGGCRRRVRGATRPPHPPGRLLPAPPPSPRGVGGFGVIAWPVHYGITGVMTFMVDQDGVVYQQDLGPQTAQKAGVIASFDPDKGWVKADMTPP